MAAADLFKRAMKASGFTKEQLRKPPTRAEFYKGLLTIVGEAAKAIQDLRRRLDAIDCPSQSALRMQLGTS